ncbi:hypothetical protein [Lysinibacillus sp. BW-2-10]|uniref:hypothetical protein n=1 Tax=Lysinibacillus sp. BW-2-10 TaxID=2590030 RepID=UPI00117EC06C|nr:hypothetical protein [Lysinibacillus sp. BW-2-10]TSI04296.1 hypothetical protein FJQ64_15240 [Lysinibacillus sp. BW-2-10]
MIRESLQEWRKHTEDLLCILNTQDKGLRDDVITQLEILLEKRENIKLTITPPFTEEERHFGTELSVLEKELGGKLNILFKDIQNDIGISQKKKSTIHAYMDPYSQVFRDGTFYDKKN